MRTVLLIGSRGPTLTALSGLLDTFGCHVLHAAAPGQHGHFVELGLAIIEFCPQDTSFTALMEQVGRLAPLRTLVVGPELPQSQAAQLLAPEHVGGYLKINAPTDEKRKLLKTWLPELPRTVLTLGPLQLDIQQQTACYGTQPLTLTPTEFRLLRALMQRPGQRTGCATLEALATCGDVAAHLGNMRRKLAAWSGVPLLRGNPSQGYVLDARRHSRLRADPGHALRTHLQRLV